MVGGRGWKRQHDRGALCVHVGRLQNTRSRGPRKGAYGVPALGDSALTLETPQPVEAGRVAEEEPLLCGLGLCSSLPALFPLRSWDREERDLRAGAAAASTEPEGTLQREPRNNWENMLEVTSRAQGTPKERGRNRWDSENPPRHANS